MLKTCRSCGESKPVGEYRRDKTRPDGYSYVCKMCAKQKDRAYRQQPETKEKKRILQQAYGDRYKGKYKDRYKGRYRETYARAVKEWHSQNPDARKAHRAVEKATTEGTLLPVAKCKCANCESPADHYHHFLGYAVEHHLDVIPMCTTCHRTLHAESQ